MLQSPKRLVDVKADIARRVPDFYIPAHQTTETLMENKKAAAITQTFLSTIQHLTHSALIAGSIRRGNTTVKDAELVVEPTSTSDLLARLDYLVINKTIARAVYPDGKTRWGSLYRGLDYLELRIEMFLCDRNNRGYIQWLRTGSADANQYMLVSKRYHPAIRFADGYVWYGESLLSVPTEEILFRLLGIPYVEPAQRTAGTYQRLYTRNPQPFIDPATLVTPHPKLPTQNNLL